jgi:hypothetical protein
MGIGGTNITIGGVGMYDTGAPYLVRFATGVIRFHHHSNSPSSMSYALMPMNRAGNKRCLVTITLLITPLHVQARVYQPLHLVLLITPLQRAWRYQYQWILCTIPMHYHYSHLVIVIAHLIVHMTTQHCNEWA